MALVQMKLQRGQAQCQVELVAGAVAHAGNAHQSLVGAQAVQGQRLTFEVDRQLLERAQRECAEDLTGARQHGALSGLAVTVDGPLQQP